MNENRQIAFAGNFRQSCDCCIAALGKKGLCNRSIRAIFDPRKAPGHPGRAPHEAEAKEYVMPVIAQTTAAIAESGLRGRFVAAIQRMQESRARRVVYRQTVRELNALTNRDLDDLGINRGMIAHLAEEAAWGNKA